jgi:hypothetical protein
MTRRLQTVEGSAADGMPLARAQLLVYPLYQNEEATSVHNPLSVGHRRIGPFLDHH